MGYTRRCTDITDTIRQGVKHPWETAQRDDGICSLATPDETLLCSIAGQVGNLDDPPEKPIFVRQCASIRIDRWRFTVKRKQEKKFSQHTPETGGDE